MADRLHDGESVQPIKRGERENVQQPSVMIADQGGNVKPRPRLQLLTLGEVAARLTVSRRTVERHIERGELPVVRLGGLRDSVRVSEDALRRFVDNRERRELRGSGRARR